MKKTTSQAIAFLREIGAKNVHDRFQAKAELVRRLSEKEADEVISQGADTPNIFAVSEDEHRKTMMFLNESYERSIASSITLDYDLYRAEFEICEGKKELFGKKILEYGCRNGIQSSFLGRLLPDSQILSIDDCDCGLAHAAALRDRLGIANVAFRKDSLETLPKGEKYDTVVLTQTLPRKGIAPGISSAYVNFLEEVELHRNDSLRRYVDSIVDHVAERGRLVFMDQMHFGAEILALVLELCSRGFRWLDDASNRGDSFLYAKHRVLFFGPHVLFFEKVGGDVDLRDTQKRFVSCMSSKQCKELPGCYVNEAAQKQLLMHAGEIVVGFSATFEYERETSDVVASVIYRDIQVEGTYWREMQTPNEISVCKYVDKTAAWASEDVWADAQSVIADAPDSITLLTGSYDDIEREETTDYSRLPCRPADIEARPSFDATTGGETSLLPKFSLSATSAGRSLTDVKERRPHEVIKDLIDKLDPKASKKNDEPRFRLVNKNHGQVAANDRKRRNASVVADKDVAEKTAPGSGLKLTYFAKAGRLNVEDQNSASQWCATGNGITIDGESVESSGGMQIGDTGLFIETTNREIRLRDGNCGYRFTIKLS